MNEIITFHRPLDSFLIVVPQLPPKFEPPENLDTLIKGVFFLVLQEF